MSRTTGRPAEVLREGSGIKVGRTAGDGLTRVDISRMPGISPGKRPPAPDLSSTDAQQRLVAQGSDRDEFFPHTGSRVRRPSDAINSEWQNRCGRLWTELINDLPERAVFRGESA